MAPVLAASLGFSGQASNRVEATIKSDAAVEPGRTNASTHQRGAQGTSLDDCGEAPDFGCSSSATVSEIAVYIYNFGQYDKVEQDKIPCVPSGMDAFFLVDEATLEGSKDALDVWASQGWKITKVSTLNETEQVSALRVTAKNVKFTPPAWLLDSSKYSWVVTFDSTLGLNLAKLSDFITRRSLSPLILLKWYWDDECSGYSCFKEELDDMLNNRPGYITTSKAEIEKWVEYLDTMKNANKIRMPVYWETCIILRNIRHELAGVVQQAFSQTYLKCREIQRDQFVLPYYIEINDLLATTYSATREEFQTELNLCMLNEHATRNLEVSYSKLATLQRTSDEPF